MCADFQNKFMNIHTTAGGAMIFASSIMQLYISNSYNPWRKTLEQLTHSMSRNDKAHLSFSQPVAHYAL